MEEAKDSSLVDQNTSSIILSKEVEDSSLMNIIPMEEAKDSSLMSPTTFKQSPVRNQKILPQSIPNEEVDDSSPMSPIHQKKKNLQRGSRRFFLKVLSEP